MKLKDDSVNFDGVNRTILHACVVAEPIMEKWGEFVVTSANDGRHSKNSLHYKGKAVDIRIWALKKDEDKTQAIRELKLALGSDYDIVLEPDHIHIEYDPKGTLL